jgi:transglutaminase-like putative cysteine protease
MQTGYGGRRLRIVHTSAYQYVSDVFASFNEVRMTPLDVDRQVLIRHDLHLEPRGVVHAYRDYWGAGVEAFDLHLPHRSLEVTATSIVDTPPGHPEAPGLSWKEIHAPAVGDRWCEFLEQTSYVDDAAADPDRAALVAELRALPRPADAVRAVVSEVHRRMRYTPGVTTVRTTAHEAWAAKHGVCQDFTHAALSLLRSLGIPSRYVSGYLHTEEQAIGETVVGESHAWIETWDGAWESFDPTNDRVVGSAHVTVARGRDYNDVPPMKGLYAGGGAATLSVSVQMTQLVR